MRSIYKIVVCSLLTLSITSCEKDLLEKEQYQKEIYLIGAYNRVWTTEVSYSNEEVKTYFTVSSSGTLALDRDVNVKMKINEELVDIYNKKYWTVLNEDKYYKSLDTDLYSIPSLENTVIKHAEGISAEVPVLIKTASLKIDQSYVIPVEIESTTGYPISESGYKMLILLKLKNDYSAKLCEVLSASLPGSSSVSVCPQAVPARFPPAYGFFLVRSCRGGASPKKHSGLQPIMLLSRYNVVL